MGDQDVSFIGEKFSYQVCMSAEPKTIYYVVYCSRSVIIGPRGLIGLNIVVWVECLNITLKQTSDVIWENQKALWAFSRQRTTAANSHAKMNITRKEVLSVLSGICRNKSNRCLCKTVRQNSNSRIIIVLISVCS